MKTGDVEKIRQHKELRRETNRDSGMKRRLREKAQDAVNEKHGDLDQAQRDALVEKKMKENIEKVITTKRVLLKRLGKPESDFTIKEVD